MAGINEVMVALREWYQQRESLSADCQKLGISSSDEAAWGRELARRCEPLRELCREIFK